MAIAALLVWLELSLSIPKFELDGNEVSVPRSGGEKNYVCAEPRSWECLELTFPSLNTSTGIQNFSQHVYTGLCSLFWETCRGMPLGSDPPL